MSVIIENMNMPSFCLFCPFNILNYCVAAGDKYISELKDKSLLEAARMSRPAWCPLKGVKESEGE